MYYYSGNMESETKGGMSPPEVPVEHESAQQARGEAPPPPYSSVEEGATAPQDAGGFVQPPPPVAPQTQYVSQPAPTLIVTQQPVITYTCCTDASLNSSENGGVSYVV